MYLLWVMYINELLTNASPNLLGRCHPGYSNRAVLKHVSSPQGHPPSGQYGQQSHYSNMNKTRRVVNVNVNVTMKHSFIRRGFIRVSRSINMENIVTTFLTFWLLSRCFGPTQPPSTPPYFKKMIKRIIHHSLCIMSAPMLVHEVSHPWAHLPQLCWSRGSRRCQSTVCLGSHWPNELDFMSNRALS